MYIPICLGMPRSASRLTWQIANALLPPEPEGWQDTLVSTEIRRIHGISKASWPWRSHGYLRGTDPVLYTFRNPLEAYFSLLSRSGDQRHHNVLDLVLLQNEIIDKLRADEAHGRNVLWLKYEDLYEREDQRVKLISEFLHCNYSDEDLLKLSESVSIKKNLDRVNSIPREESFCSYKDRPHGLQPGHVNDKTMGQPGSYLQLYSSYIPELSLKPGFKDLTLLASKLDY